MVLHLDSGVTWERLTPLPDGDVDFVEATYAVGGASGIDGQRIRHMGREYGIVLSGELELTVGSETFLLGPGDSCSFSSDDPHRLANPGQEPTRVIWLVVGRRGLDPRRFNLQGELDR